jgi:hypothetical protein
LLDKIKKLIADQSLMSFFCCNRIGEIRRGLPSFVAEAIFAGIASYPEDNRRNKASTLKKPTLFCVEPRSSSITQARCLFAYCAGIGDKGNELI